MKDRFTQVQIINMIKDQQSAISTPELCRQYGIGQSTFYRWKAQYGGMSASQGQKLKHLEKENNKLKRLLAELSLDQVMLQEVIAKKD